MTGRHAAPTWDPQQYLRHADHRTRPFHDLLARVPDLPGRTRARIADLGCGPGNVTALLADRWPDARITGYDNSPEMLDEAQRHAGPTPGGGRLDFAHADAADLDARRRPYDLIVSNAAAPVGPRPRRPLPRLARRPRPRRHLRLPGPRQLRPRPATPCCASLPTSPRWRDRLGGTLRHADAVLDPAGYLDRLTALGCAADVWETTYVQLLQGEDPVLDWVKGTALRPVLTALADDPAGPGRLPRRIPRRCCATPTRRARTAPSSRSAASSPSAAQARREPMHQPPSTTSSSPPRPAREDAAARLLRRTSSA